MPYQRKTRKQQKTEVQHTTNDNICYEKKIADTMVYKKPHRHT